MKKNMYVSSTTSIVKQGTVICLLRAQQQHCACTVLSMYVMLHHLIFLNGCHRKSPLLKGLYFCNVSGFDTLHSLNSYSRRVLCMGSAKWYFNGQLQMLICETIKCRVYRHFAYEAKPLHCHMSGLIVSVGGR